MTDLSLEEARKNLDVIEHQGVKGMKWGVRKKPTSAEITDARLRVQAKNIKYVQQRRKIKSQDVSRATKRTQLKDLKTSTLANPDRLTALRLTKGEKAVVGVLALVPGAQVGIAVGAGANVLERVAVKRAIAKTSK